LALQVLRALNSLVAIHVERHETEEPRGIDRQTDDVRIGPRNLRHEFGEGQFRDIPFAVESEAGKNLVMAEREPGRLNAFRLHAAESEIAEMVVIGGGDRKLQRTHGVYAFLRFASILSQISAAPSGPPRFLIERKPVGEVTLISVR